MKPCSVSFEMKVTVLLFPFRFPRLVFRSGKPPLRNKLACRPPTVIHDELETCILDLLCVAQGEDRDVSLRDLHKPLAIGQPQVLRTVWQMADAGTIALTIVHHDPLASKLRLPTIR